MDSPERVEALSAFLDCSARSAAALAGAMRARDFAPGKVLSHQGENDRTMWLILEGTIQLQAVSVEGRATVLSAFGPGELVGGFDAERESGFDTRALGRVSALEVDAIDLHRLVREWPDLGAGLSRIYAGQLHAVLDRLAERVTLTAVGRCYRELLRLAEQSDTIAPPPVIAALALSAQTTRETGSRAINTLERRGIIARTQDHLTIVSRRMLEELVC